MSASWFFVATCSIVMVLSTRCDLKWCSLIERCFVRGRFLWDVAILIQLGLSSNVLQTILGVDLLMGRPLDSRYYKMWMIPITSRRAVESAIYSAAVVLRAIRDYIVDFHTRGPPVYVMTKPVLECVDSGSWDDRCYQEPA